MQLVGSELCMYWTVVHKMYNIRCWCTFIIDFRTKFLTCSSWFNIYYGNSNLNKPLYVGRLLLACIQTLLLLPRSLQLKERVFASNGKKFMPGYMTLIYHWRFTLHGEASADCKLIKVRYVANFACHFDWYTFWLY